MSLTIELNRYLSVRRSLGCDLGTAERILRRFTRFADREDAVCIDTAVPALARHAGRGLLLDPRGKAHCCAPVRTVAEQLRSST